MVRPINPELYKLLVRRFGTVKIANPGAKANIKYTRHGGRIDCDVKEGERYCVCCPRCGETRYRLWFSYMYHQFDQVVGRRLDHLIYCFNCVDDFQDFYDLELLPFAKNLGAQKIDTSAITNTVVEVKLPPDMLLTSQLDIGHPGYQFLVDRNIDPKIAGDVWKLGYCDPYCDVYAAKHRIILPIYNKQKLVGWQARAIDMTGTKNKYMSAYGMRRNSCLFNLDNAASQPIGVICEGPFDAMRVGLPGIALFGCTMSEEQVSLISNAFKGKPLILLLDSDKAGTKGGNKIFKRLNIYGHPYSHIELVRLSNDKKDPGDYTHSALWAELNEIVVNKFKLPAIGGNINIDYEK